MATDPGGGGGCGTDKAIEHARVCPGACTKQKWVSASALTPSAGLTPEKKTYVCCLQVQVPGVSRGELYGEEKGCLARRPHSRILRIWEDATFASRLGVGSPGSGLEE